MLGCRCPGAPPPPPPARPCHAGGCVCAARPCRAPLSVRGIRRGLSPEVSSGGASALPAAAGLSLLCFSLPLSREGRYPCPSSHFPDPAPWPPKQCTRPAAVRHHRRARPRVVTPVVPARPGARPEAVRHRRRARPRVVTPAVSARPEAVPPLRAAGRPLRPRRPRRRRGTEAALLPHRVRRPAPTVAPWSRRRLRASPRRTMQAAD